MEAAQASVEDELNKELNKLAAKQIEGQAALEVKQVKEMRAMEEELKAEELNAGKQVHEQIEKQKQKVSDQETYS